jgi:hypothetical protein
VSSKYHRRPQANFHGSMEKFPRVLPTVWYNRVRKFHGDGATFNLMQPGRTRSSLLLSAKPSSRKSILPGAVVLLCLPVLLLIRVAGVLAGVQPASDPNLERINAIVNEFRNQLQMEQEIEVTITAANDRMVSVEHTTKKLGGTGAFIMCFDENFLSSLDQDELRAAIAHELGHVWIFSHHPYLQTEALANQIALRVVNRQSLEKIYHKLWSHLGVSGNLEEFLGLDPTHSASSAGPR